MRFFLLPIVVLTLVGACQHTRQAAAGGAATAPATAASAATPTQAPAVIRFERTPCMGFCPTFVAELTTDGILRYHTGPNAPYPRDTTAQVAPDVVRNIQTEAAAMRFAQLPADEYGHGMMDAPSLILTINGHRVTSIGGEGPDALKSLHRYLDQQIKEALGL